MFDEEKTGKEKTRDAVSLSYGGKVMLKSFSFPYIQYRK
jgi:hypothetical protein